MSDQLPVQVSIAEIKNETPSVKTFFFDREFPFEPGQFVMVWVPGVDEVPMALSSANSITVQKVGDATGAMFDLVAGATFWVSGGRSGTGLPKVRKCSPSPGVSGRRHSCRSPAQIA